MSPQSITLAILVVATILLLSERLRPDLVALLVLLSLGATRVLTQEEAFSGFGRSAVVTLLAVFIMVEGLLRVGVAEALSALLSRLAGTSEKRMVVVVMTCGAILSLFMNNIAAASMMLPAVGGAARRSFVSPSRLLMPLAFGTILGGMATLLTTNNLIASGVLSGMGLPSFGLLSFAPIGVPMLIAGVAYMVLYGRTLLPTMAAERQQALNEAEADLVGVYGLGEKLFRAEVPAGSTLIGRHISDSRLRENFQLTVIAVERSPQLILSPSPELTMQRGDVLVLKGDIEDFKARDVEPYMKILPAREWTEETLSAPTHVVVEAMLSPRSELIGQTARAIHFRARYGMNILAIWRRRDQLLTGVREIALQFGDALLLEGPRAQLPVLKKEKDLILMSDVDDPSDHGAPNGALGTRAYRMLALAIFGASFLVAAIYPSLIGEIMLGGALAMLLCGILTMDDAYRAIDWRSIFLVAGMLPLGLAMTKTGAAQKISTQLVSTFGFFGVYGLLASLVLTGFLLTQVMNGAAVTAVIAPIAVHAAQSSGLQPAGFVMAVAIASSMAFLTPLGHPVNILVMGQGGYRFRDYGRVGAGFSLVLLVLLLLLIPLMWPLH